MDYIVCLYNEVKKCVHFVGKPHCSSRGNFTKEIIQTYHISNKTVALLPAKEIEYDTLVMLEDKETKHVRQTPFNLIKLACYTHDWTTYEGRRDAIVKQTGYDQKTPILISIINDICFFPTQSPNHIDNIWIAFHHILEIGRTPMKQVTQQAQSVVFFKNGQELVLNVSFHTLKNQYKRTLECMLRIKGNRLEALQEIYPS